LTANPCILTVADGTWLVVRRDDFSQGSLEEARACVEGTPTGSEFPGPTVDRWQSCRSRHGHRRKAPGDSAPTRTGVADRMQSSGLAVSRKEVNANRTKSGLASLISKKCGITYPQAASNVALPDNSYDLYVSLRTYNSSFFDTTAAIREAHRVLKPEASIIVCVANGFLCTQRRCIAPGLILPGTNFVDLYRGMDTARRVRAELGHAGFRNTRVMPSTTEILRSYGQVCGPVPTHVPIAKRSHKDLNSSDQASGSPLPTIVVASWRASRMDVIPLIPEPCPFSIHVRVAWCSNRFLPLRVKEVNAQ
jgi:hypothetical protein